MSKKTNDAKEQPQDIPTGGRTLERFTPEEIEELRRALGLQDVPAQIQKLLQARDQKLIHDIRLEVAKAQMGGGTASGGQPQQQQQQQQQPQESPMELIGGLAKSIIQELKSNQPSGEGMFQARMMDYFFKLLDQNVQRNEAINARLAGQLGKEALHTSG